MKRILLLIVFGISSTIAIAQTTWTGLGANTNWNNTDNWDTNMVPTASDDVIIPTGFTVTLNVVGTVQSLGVQGNSTFDINTNLTFSQPSTFGSGTTINWNAGTLLGSSAVLTNNGTINTFASNVTLGGGTTLSNEGQINITGAGDIFIATGGLLINETSGTLSMLENGGNVSETGAGINQFNNLGLVIVNLPDLTDQVTINCDFNNSGTIQVDSGILNFSNATVGGQVLMGGIYNVASGCALELDNEITLTGTLTGNLNGDFILRSTVRINIGDTASFDFSGNATVTWSSGQFFGGGTLINVSTINTVTGNVFVGVGTTLSNQGQINLTNTGDIFIVTDGVLDNTSSGTISMLENGANISESGGGINQFNNNGLILVDLPNPNDQVTINCEFNNNDSTIQVDSGILNFSNATVGGQILMGGIYNVASGGAVELDNEITLTGTLIGSLNGDFILRSTVRINNGDTASFDFSGNATVTWSSGQFFGGGTLSNMSTINTLAGNVFIGAETTLSNQGQINLTGAGDIFIQTSGVLDNTPSGTISMLENGANISESGAGTNQFNNNGLILVDLPSTTDQVTINCEFNNNDSTIQVTSGILNFSNSTIGAQVLMDGTYNVETEGVLELDNEITLTGTLTGTLDGDFVIRSNTRINNGDSASFDFSGNATVTWASGTLIGGGTLTNNSIMVNSTSNTIIDGPTILINNGNFNFVSGGDLFIDTDAELRNGPTGVIDFQSSGFGIFPTGAGINLLNNQGLIKNTSESGIVIGAESQNSGVIEATTGGINFTVSLDNLAGGVFTGVADLNLPPPASFTNNGNVAPGLSPGTLNIIGNYTSTSNSVLNVELNGLTPDTEHDVLAITGNNIVFEGTVDVALGFQPNIGDTFTIATVSGTNAIENLVSPIYAEYDCLQYTFDVSYPNNNSVMLTVSAEEDVHDPIVITQNIDVELDGSGNATITPNDIDDGSSDNCGIDTMSLDVFSFTCADLGVNTVTLTVTDVNGNSANGTAMVTVEDNINPTAVTQNIVVALDASGNASILASQIDNGSTDNCSIVSLDIDVSDFTCADLGDNTVELTVTDQSGNSNSATAIVTVEDNINPTAVTQDIVVALDASGNASIIASQIDNGSTDNCSITSMDIDISDFTCADLGDNNVELTVTDQSGNSGSTTATVTVVDLIDPVINCPDGFEVESEGGYALPDYVLEGDVTASDNCGFSVVQTPLPGTVLPNGDYIIEFDVTDDAGNTANCFFELKVVDTTLSIDDLELSNNDILLFPNPVRDTFTIKNNSRLNLRNAEIYDVSGRTIKILDLRNMAVEEEVSFANYAQGIYLVKIYAENNSSLIKRFVKK